MVFLKRIEKIVGTLLFYTVMPNTAYLTLLDYWLIFGLIMPFIIFTTEVMVELSKNWNKEVKIIIGNNKVLDSKTLKGKVKSSFNGKCLMQTALPIISALFVVAYCVIVVVVYYDIGEQEMNTNSNSTIRNNTKGC